MNWFDVHILLFLNQFANRWLWLDADIARVYSTTLIGGGTTMAIAWWALFDNEEEGRLRKHHELLLGAMLLCGFGTLAARALALALPFRARPMRTPELHFQLPHGEQLRLLGWSSFPSDHATLFFGLAMGVLFVSRPLGWLAIAWVTAVISFPALSRSSLAYRRHRRRLPGNGFCAHCKDSDSKKVGRAVHGEMVSPISGNFLGNFVSLELRGHKSLRRRPPLVAITLAPNSSLTDPRPGTRRFAFPFPLHFRPLT